MSVFDGKNVNVPDPCSHCFMSQECKVAYQEGDWAAGECADNLVEAHQIALATHDAAISSAEAERIRKGAAASPAGRMVLLQAVLAARSRSFQE